MNFAERHGRAVPPAGLPRRRQVVAGCVLAVIVVHLLVAQLTLVLAVVLVLAGRLSRWRPSWLLVPAAVGLAWILVAGPVHAFAGFAAGPMAVLGYLGRRQPVPGLSGWLPGQLPVALVAGAAEAAAAGWLALRRTAVTPRPGAVAVVRRALTSVRIRTGGVLTRDGCALGVVPSTGAVAELRWAELAGGLLVTGTAPREVAMTSLQVVHAALRRRKPLIVLAADAQVAATLRAACAATGVPLRTGEELVDQPGASQLWGRRTQLASPELPDLGQVVRERSAAFIAAGSPDMVARACADIAAVAADLRRIGVDGDGLVWVPDGDRVPGDTLAALLRDGCSGGLPAVISVTSPEVAADLAGRTGALLIHRVADPGLAETLSGRTGTQGVLALRPGEFVLAVSLPRPRLTALGRLVPARLPAMAGG